MKKKLVTAVLAASMLVGSLGGISTPAEAKTDSHKIVFYRAQSSRTCTVEPIEVGEEMWAAVYSLGSVKTGLSVGIKGKVKWKVVSGKKVIKITKENTEGEESQVWYKGLRAGTAKLQCTNRKRKLTFKIKVIKPKVFKVKKVTPAIAKKIDQYRRKNEFFHVKFIAKSRKSATNMNYKLNAEIRKQNPYSIALAPWDWGETKTRFKNSLEKTSKNTWICDCHHNKTDMDFNVGSMYTEIQSYMKPLFAKGKTLYPNIFSGSTFSKLSEAEQVFYLFDIACRSNSDASKVIEYTVMGLGYREGESYVFNSNVYVEEVKAPNGKKFNITYYTPKGKSAYVEREASEEYLEKYSEQAIEIWRYVNDERIRSLNVLEYLEKYGRK